MSLTHCPFCLADAGGHSASCPVADRLELIPADVEISGTDVPVYLGEGPDRVLVGRGDVDGGFMSITLDVDTAGFDSFGSAVAEPVAFSAIRTINDRLQAAFAELSDAAAKLGPRLEPESHAILERALAEYSTRDLVGPLPVLHRRECPSCAATGLRQDAAFWEAVDAVADERMPIEELQKMPRCETCGGSGYVS